MDVVIDLIMEIIVTIVMPMDMMYNFLCVKQKGEKYFSNYFIYLKNV